VGSLSKRFRLEFMELMVSVAYQPDVDAVGQSNTCDDTNGVAGSCLRVCGHVAVNHDSLFQWVPRLLDEALKKSVAVEEAVVIILSLECRSPCPRSAGSTSWGDMYHCHIKVDKSLNRESREDMGSNPPGANESPAGARQCTVDLLHVIHRPNGHEDVRLDSVFNFHRHAVQRENFKDKLCYRHGSGDDIAERGEKPLGP